MSRLALVLLALLASVPAAAAGHGETPRQHVSIDRGWRFAFGDARDPARDFGFGTHDFFGAKTGYGDGPAAPDFDDRGWRRLDLPHDWAVEAPFDRTASASHGFKAVGPGFPARSIGWYRRTLDIPTTDRGRRVTITFNGIFRDAQVWFNGHHLGTEASGYTPVTYDLTDYADFGGKNVVAVRVDATGEEGWFYEGAGIYRHVWLTVTDPVHIAENGVFASSVVANGNAAIAVETRIADDSEIPAAVTVEQALLDSDDRRVAAAAVVPLSVAARNGGTARAKLAVTAPRLWSPETPTLYTLITTLRRDGAAVDRVTTKIGIRTIRWDGATGFWLNGRNIKLKGVNLHQDHAGVGTAMPDALVAWRLERMKAMGANAIRSAHNPASPALLDAADRLGLMVIDEQRMMGTTPTLMGELDGMIRRDRNHPSVILWSVGNEEWKIEGNEIGRRLTRRMQDEARRLDPTRRATVAMSGGMMTGSGTTTDVAGANYRRNHDLDAYHARFPETPVVLTEEGAMRTTRGAYADDPATATIAAYGRPPDSRYQSDMEDAWRFVMARPWLAGMFVWTGMDYRGETRPFGWPATLSQSGMADLTGALKDNGWFLKSVWTEAPMVHLLPHWTWPGREGQPIEVWAYADVDAVELSLNGHSLGRKAMPRGGHLVWQVPYAPGTLLARGYRGGREVARDSVATADAPAALALTATRTTLAADGSDVAVVDVAATDAAGHPVPVAANDVTFRVEGGVRLIGVGNGDPASHEPDRLVAPDPIWRRALFNGHAQAIVEAGDTPGTATLIATAPGLKPARLPLRMIKEAP